MDIKKIKALAELLDKYSLTDLEYTENDNKIVLRREIKETVIQQPSISMPAQVIANEINEPVHSFGDINEITSPLIGVFYSSPSPDSKPFVSIGSKVKKGDILCIVEAMKCMNEITSDCDGEIVDICAENGQIVEYGQILFKVI
jgi:acetyl-CoA carboxylase, biotin carboxyl carrier protein